MKDYFENKDISIKEFFAEQGMEDNKDLFMEKTNFGTSMKIILGKLYLTIFGKSITTEIGN